MKTRLDIYIHKEQNGKMTSHIHSQRLKSKQDFAPTFTNIKIKKGIEMYIHKDYNEKRDIHKD